MKALCWMGKYSVAVHNVPDPKILNPRDAIVRITSTCICGSDLHLYDGYVPTMKTGDIIGHEFMGIVEDVGPDVGGAVKKGDRVIVPFPIACGRCWFCEHQLTSLCDNSNPNASLQEKILGHPTSGIFGYSHLFGGYAGGQAEAARVPFADVMCRKVPQDLPDEQVVFLTDIFPTGYMAAENCNIQRGDTIAVWGCGPVGQFTIRSCFLLGAERVIAIDDVPERLAMARAGGAETLDFSQEYIFDQLREMTGGRGPDACIDAVGMEAHGMSPDAVYDQVKAKLYMATDRPHVLRQAINCCRKGGTVSVPGVYAGLVDKIPFGAAMNKGLTLKTGQTHVHRYLPTLIDHIQQGRIDPSFVITHRFPLAEAPQAYKIFSKRTENCIKCVLKPS